MLFTALQQYDSAQIQAELIQYLTELGLDESILNTTLRGDITIGSLTSGLTERLIAKAAEEDRRRFREKQSEGIARAQKAGVAIGRPTRKQDKRFHKVRDMYLAQEVTGQEAARLLGVAPSTFYRWLRQEGKPSSPPSAYRRRSPAPVPPSKAGSVPVRSPLFSVRYRMFHRMRSNAIKHRIVSLFHCSKSGFYDTLKAHQ